MKKIKHIIHIIKQLIVEKNISNKDVFALKIGMNRQTFRNQLSGSTKMTVETLLKIAEGLNVSPCYFLIAKKSKSKPSNTR